jgi:ribosomal protein S7
MAAQRAQKNLTVMFTDISGFTKHTETISREALMSRLDTHNELLMPIVAHFDGRIVKTIGDAFLITFESPTNAVQCGLFMQHTLGKYNVDKPDDQQIHIKVSINSGEVTVTESDVFGDPVNVAAKIEKATNPDEIYFTESVFLAMNKAEVPTSFVKTFRPKGAESSEIKLYKVAMDEGDERYKKVIANTHIDKEKNKTRVLELSNLAEKEFVRYQDTLDALVESQGKSSRGVVIAVIAAAVILAVAVIIGFSMFAGGDKPDAQLAKDVRAYLASDKPGEARTRIDNYIGEFGADDTTATLQNEVRDYEVGKVIADADALIADGRPEDARNAITKHFGSNGLTEPAKKALARADAYLNARDQISAGKAEEAAAALNAAFADTNPSREIKRLRDQAAALISVDKMMKSEERFKEPMRMFGAVTAAFGEDTTNAAALTDIEEALANELYRAAKSNGYDSANGDYENYRKRVPNLPTWSWVKAHMNMGALWFLRTDPSVSRYSDSEVYWAKWREVRDYVKDKPEKNYQFGCFLYMLARSEFNATCDGAEQWEQALKADPSLAGRHAELTAPYYVEFGGDRANLGKDLKSDLKYMLGCFAGGIYPMRDLIKRLYYNDLRDTLLSYVNSTDEQFQTEQMNALALLTEMGDAELIKDRFVVFRAQFDEFVSGDGVERHHAKALFEAPMTLDDYKEFRRLIDSNLTDVNNKTGRFSSYTKAGPNLQQLLDDIRVAQPSLTTQFEG